VMFWFNKLLNIRCYFFFVFPPWCFFLVGGGGGQWNISGESFLSGIVIYGLYNDAFSFTRLYMVDVFDGW